MVEGDRIGLELEVHRHLQVRYLVAATGWQF